ncbi:MAG: hypothetical protein ABFD64_12800 [Armatimonadota bacterium]
MNNLTMWKRMLWKELRTGWLIGLYALALPIVLHTIRRLGGQAFITFQPVNLLLFWVALIAARKGSIKSEQGHIETHLPIQPIIQWIIGNVILMIAAGLIGAWAGGFLGYYLNKDVTVYLTAWMLFYSAIFAVSYLFGFIVNTWFALFVDLVWLLLFLAVLPKDDIVFMMICNTVLLAGSLVGTYHLHLTMQRVLIKRKQLVSTGVALIVLASLILAFIVANNNTESSDSGDFLVSPDDSYVVALGENPVTGDTVEMSDRVKGKTISRTFEHRSYLLGVTDRRMIYLAQQKPDSNEVKIIVWDSARNTLRQLASVPTGKNALANTRTPLIMFQPIYLSRGFVSSDARHALLITKSQAGGGIDLWLVDLVNNRSKILIANMFLSTYSVVWTSKKAVLSSYEKVIVEVDLQTWKAVVREIGEDAK